VHHVIQPALQELQQHLAGDSLLHSGLFEVAPELPFQYSVDAPYFLFLTQLQGVIGKAGTA